MEEIIESGKLFVQEYGMLGLAIISFTEAFINPIPVAPIMAAWIVMGLPAFPAFLVTVISNLLGAIVGFVLGKKLGHPAAIWIFGKEKIEKAEVFFQKWGEIGVIIAAFTPLPFKVATWAAGVFEMKFWRFFLSALLGRVAYFLLVLGAVVFGWAFLDLLLR